MLEDRDYMRANSGRANWSITTTLTVVLGVIYALQCINDVYLHTPVEDWLALTPACFERGWIWQLLTFQFLHATLWHVVGNLIVFWWVGHYLENILGKGKFLLAMFGSGAIGGILQALLMILFPERFGGYVVGASAGVAGLFAIYALLEKNSQILLYFIFPIRAITLLWAFGIISLFFTVVPTPREMELAHAAHLGGILAGIAWVKLGWHRDYIMLPGTNLFDRFKRRKKSVAEESSSAEEFLQREVDPILEKISAHGIQSLTAREREILEKARSKMDRR